MRAPDSCIVATMRSLFPLTFRQSSGSMIPVLSMKKKKCSFLRDARLSICIKIRLLRKKACIISAIHWNPGYARFRSRPWGPTRPSYARRHRACSSCARSCCRSSRRREYVLVPQLARAWRMAGSRCQPANGLPRFSSWHLFLFRCK